MTTPSREHIEPKESPGPLAAAPPESSPDRFRLVMAAFARAIAAPPAERARLLDRELGGGGDAALRAEVEEMLRVDAEHGSVGLRTGAGLGIAGEASPNWAEGLSVGPSHASEIPVLAGNYRIVRIIGEGGMGVVYEAEQTMPRRVVALKAIRSGLIGRHLLARFAREAHILGRLAHPGIAQIFEAGVVQDGATPGGEQAYLVMEYVDGTTLTEHAAKNAMNIRDRMELVARVCDAVQHAHQRRVIHRDLKPANILVDSSGQPKVLDFGVAALAADRTDLPEAADETSQSAAAPTSLETLGSHVVGTLAYMSPEQLTLDGAPDTRSDIYSLGVILYELLSGTLPLAVRGLPLDEAAKLVAAERPIPLGRIKRALRGDPEAIVAKALERDREARYQSAAEMARDIRRSAIGEPISARGASLRYLLRTSIRRHRATVALVAIALVAMTALAVYAAIIGVHNTRLAHELAGQLSDSQIERARLLAHTDQASAAEEALWSELARRPDSRLARWALWDLYSRSPALATLPNQGVSAFDAAYSPDGNIIAIANQPAGQVALWTSDLSQQIRTVDVGSKRALAVAFSPDGSRFATGDAEGRMHIWNTADGSSVASVDAHKDGIGRLQYSPDGRLIAVGGRGNLIRLFSPDAQPVRDLTGHTALVGTFAFSPDSRIFVTGSNDQSMRIWDTATGECTRIIKPPESHKGGVNAMAFSPDGSRFYSAGLERMLKIWDAKTFECVATQTDFAGYPYTIDISPDGRTMYLAADGVDVRDAADGHVLRIVTRPDGTRRAMALSPSGDRLVTASMRGRVSLLETRLEAARHEFEVTSNFYCQLAASPDGNTIAAPGDFGTVRLIPAARWNERTEFRLDPGHVAAARSLAYSPDGAVLVCGTQDGEIRTWDVRGNKPMGKVLISAGKSVLTLCISPDGSTLLAGNAVGRAGLWRLPNLEPIGDLDVSSLSLSGPILTSAWSPDGRLFTIGSTADVFGIWRMGDSLRPYATISVHEPQTAVAFSPDSRHLLVGLDKAILVVDCRTGEIERTLMGLAQAAVGFAFAGTDTLISASRDRTLRVWEWPSGIPLLTLDVGPRQPGSLVASPDGRWAAAMVERGGVVAWDLDYYKRHVVGNAAWNLSRLDEPMKPEAERGLMDSLRSAATRPRAPSP